MEINIIQARKELSKQINRVANDQERITITRHGKPVAVLISVEDLELLEELEYQLDKKAIEEAWAEQGDDPLISFDKVKSDLGL